MVKLIGITGNVAGGKSTLSKIVRISFNIPVFNSDAVVRSLYTCNTRVLKEISTILPCAIRNNILIREKLAKSMTTNPDKFKQIRNLIIGEVYIKLKQFIHARQHLNIIVAEIPLLFEFGFEKLCYKTITIYANQNKRRLHFQNRKKGVGVFSVYEREQLPENIKKGLADYVINNNLSTHNLYKQLHKILKQLHRDNNIGQRKIITQKNLQLYNKSILLYRSSNPVVNRF